jgi:hypothetical protein
MPNKSNSTYRQYVELRVGFCVVLRIKKAVQIRTAFILITNSVNYHRFA